MSQQKVDRYKQEKAHRKERLEKEKKRKKLLRIFCGGAFCHIGIWRIFCCVPYPLSKCTAQFASP